MTRSTTNHKAGYSLLFKAAILLFWLLVWQLLYLLVRKDLLLVSPLHTLWRLIELLPSPRFWSSVLLTGLRVITGFACSLVAGMILAALTARSRLLLGLFSPVIATVRATPVASFIILVLVFMSTGYIPAFIAFLMVLPIIWANLHAGITSTDPKLLEMAGLFHFSAFKKLRAVYLPWITPYLISACSSGLGFAWKSAIAAEVIARPEMSIGRQIYNAKIYMETADLFAWTVAVILLSLGIEKLTLWLLGLLKRKLLRPTS